jgi:hypothetical protein
MRLLTIPEAAMPRFYFHLRRSRDLVPDHEGAELAHVEAAYLEAFKSAQELWPILLEQRRDPLAYKFEVMDEAGRLAFELPFAEVLENTQKRERPRGPVARTSTLLSRTHLLRESLAAQIETTRNTVDQTRKLLSSLGRPRG